MDSYEASSLVFTKVKSIDPENAKKIMGYILIQDLAENDLMRLAFGPENLLHSMVIRARIHLGLSSNTSSTPSSPSTLNPIQRPGGNPFSSSSQSQSSPRVNGSWPLSANSPKSHPLMAAAAAAAESSELLDEGHLSEYLSFLSEDPELHHHHSNGGGDSGHFHRRSFSASDASDEFKPCLYFARGFCKNGSSCKFVHGCFDPQQQQPEQHEDLFRLKAAQQQQQQQQLQRQMSLSPSVYHKYMNLILQQQQQHQQHDPQRAAAAAMMMGEEIYSKFGRCSRSERSEFLSMAEKMNSASRQIYLTFPAESTFKDEDVSEYFNKFGPVQDVRIPYQQKRMFGFVTFVHPETVRFILSKGNPHFICESRVLVKPYKEKGKVLDKRQHQHQLERGEFSSCSSPTESRDSYEFSPGGGGGRMFYGANQEMMLRRKMEQVELQQAIELQGRRLMNLQLPDFHNKTEHHHQRLHNHHRSLSLGASILSPHHQHRSSFSPSHFDPIIQDLSEGHDEVTVTLPPGVLMQQSQHHSNDNGNVDVDGNGKEDVELHKSMEQSLPENLFASPTKSSGDHRSESVAEELVNESSAAATVTPNGPNSQLPGSSTVF